VRAFDKCGLDGPAVSAVIIALADAFYEAAIDQQADV